MEGTCGDFWKMVYDRRCGVVIMLSQLMEQDKVSSFITSTVSVVASCQSSVKVRTQ